MQETITRFFVVWLLMGVLYSMSSCRGGTKITTEQSDKLHSSAGMNISDYIAQMEENPPAARYRTDLQTIQASVIQKPIEMALESSVPDVRRLSVEEDHIALASFHETYGRSYLIYDLDGIYLREEPAVEQEQDDYTTETHYRMSDGAVFGIGVQQSDASRVLYCLRPDGTPYAEYTLTGTAGDAAAVFLDDGTICVKSGRTVSCFTPDLTLLCQVELSSMLGNGRLQVNGNTVVFPTSESSQFLCLDINTGSVISYDGYVKPTDVDLHANLFFDRDGNAYLRDVTGIWSYDAKTQAAELLLEWNRTEYTYNNTEVISALNSDTFLVRALDPLMDDYAVCILTLSDEDTQTKTDIRIGLIRHQNADGTKMLSQLISAFNMHSEEYHLSLIDYAMSMTDGRMDTALSQFEEDLLTGNAPDILVFGEDSLDTYNNLAEKNLFLDLDPYFGNQLLPNIAQAFTDKNGAVTLLPINMELLLFASDIPISGDTLSFSALQSVMDTLNEGEAAFSTTMDDRYPFLNTRFLGIGLQSFYNTDTGSCTFDSTSFADYIRLWEDVKSNLEQTADNGEIPADGVPLDMQMANGTLKFLEIPLSSTEVYMTAKRIFGDEPFSLYGYPAADGHAAYMTSDLMLAVMLDTEVPRGVLTALHYFLSDDIQLAPVVTQKAFSVTEAGLEKQLDEYPYYYFIPADRAYSETFRASACGYFTKQKAPIPPEYSEPYGMVEYIMTEEDRVALQEILCSMPVSRTCDVTVMEIVTEELLAYSAGIRTLEDAAKIIQSRVWIYLNE